MNQELESCKNWILWKKGDPKPDGRFRKIPLGIDGVLWDGKQTWGYQEALDAALKLFPHAPYSSAKGGIALSLQNTPYVVFDLDTKRENMLLHALLLSEFRSTYIEESVSMKGYHIIVKDSNMTRWFIEEHLGLSILSHNNDERMLKPCWVIVQPWLGVHMGDWLDMGTKNPIQEVNLMENSLVKKILERVEVYKLAEEEYWDMVHGHESDDDEEYW